LPGGAAALARALPGEARRPVVRLWFSDDSTMVLRPDDPLAVALQAAAAAILRS
jgi:hypothetical protein